MNLSRTLLRVLPIVLVGLLLERTAFAHDPGLSSANLEITPSEVDLQLTFNQRDIAGALGIPAEELRDGNTVAAEKLNAIAQHALVLQIDGVAQTPATFTSAPDANNNVEFRYRFPASANLAEIKFESLLLGQMAFGHRQAFAATDGQGHDISRRILSARDSSVVIPLSNPAGEPAPPKGTRFLEFLSLGIRHILTGYDHLLFLFGLLVVCRTPRCALLLITCFTLAHSLTLALSTFGLVNLPSRFVEATIAASILYVGLENLIRRDTVLHGRWLLTFCFGLIHGLGFASVLHEMGIAKTGLSAVVPLVAFNSGVEIGQLTIAAIVLPIIWQLRRRPTFLRVGVPACSVLVALAGGYWLLERTVLG